MYLRLITPPTVEPVTLTEAKIFLRVDHSAEDALITSLLLAAREKGEELSRRAFVTQTWQMILNAWPLGLHITIGRPPLQSVEWIKYKNSSSAESTVDASTYYVNTSTDPGEVIFRYYPGTSLLRQGAISIQFIAGYGAGASNVPERFKDAILALVAYWYENRGSAIVPAEIRDSFISQRVVWF